MTEIREEAKIGTVAVCVAQAQSHISARRAEARACPDAELCWLCA